MRLIILISALASGTASAARFMINDVTVDELASVEGVDAETANRIVALRTDRSGLDSLEELRILGLNQSTMDALRSHVFAELTLKKVSKGTYKSVSDVLQQFAHEPDVLKVQAMAMSYTKTNPALVEGWLNASKKAYALPAVTLTYDKDLDDYSTWNYIDLDGDGDVSNTERQLNTSRVDDDDSIGVRLAWRLDKLVMSSERIRVINEAQDIVKLRDKVLDEVTRVYFDRRRLQVEQLLSPASSLKGKIKNELRLQELTASIDALTGGQFSGSL